MGPQPAQHQQDLNDGGQDAVERIGHEGRNAPRAAFDIAGQTTGLTVQVKAQTERMQMPEHLERDCADRALGHLGKDVFPQLGE